LLSGVAPYRSGIYDNFNNIQDSDVLSKAVFLPEHFKANGYITLSRGKVFHTTPAKSRYDAMWDVETGKGGYGPWPTVRNIPTSLKAPDHFNYQPWSGAPSDHPDNVTAEIIVRQLKRSYNKPFFMVAGLYKPHNPWTAPKNFFDMYPMEDLVLPPMLENDWDDLPEIARKWATNRVNFEALKKSGQWKAVLRSYMACVSFMDWNLGRIITALDSSLYKDNTIVCIFADNGFHLGEKNHVEKYVLWEQSTHVLNIWRVPGVTRPGQTCSQPVNLLDIYPTLVELCGLPQPASQLDGRSIVKLLKAPQSEWAFPSITTFQQGNQAVRDKRYRYIHYNTGQEELYDHDTDPNEWYNLANTPGMQKTLVAFRNQLTKDFAPPAVGKNGGSGHE
jgi:arylsulfatase A-like enzyme